MLVEIYYYHDPEFGVELSFTPRYEDGWMPIDPQSVKFLITRNNGYKFIVDTLADALAELERDPKIQINAIYYPNGNPNNIPNPQISEYEGNLTTFTSIPF